MHEDFYRNVRLAPDRLGSLDIGLTRQYDPLRTLCFPKARAL